MARSSKLILGSAGRERPQERHSLSRRPDRLPRGDVLTLRWEMMLADSETVLASGLEFLIVDGDGRILVDHPFAAA